MGIDCQSFGCAPSSYSEAPRLFKAETEGSQRYVKHLRDFRDKELEPTTRPVPCSRFIVATSMTCGPNIIADMVALAQLKQWPQQLMFHTCRDGNYCNVGNAETIVGSDDPSAIVNASYRYIDVRLQGMKLNHRYFVSMGVQLYGETSDPDHDVGEKDIAPIKIFLLHIIFLSLHSTTIDAGRNSLRLHS